MSPLPSLEPFLFKALRRSWWLVPLPAAWRTSVRTALQRTRLGGRAAAVLAPGAKAAASLSALNTLLEKAAELPADRRRAVHDRAKALFATQLASGNTPFYKKKTARLLFGHGLYEEALAAINIVLARDEDDAGILFFKSRVLIALLRYDEALAVSLRVLEREPSHTGGLHHARILPHMRDSDARRPLTCDVEEIAGLVRATPQAQAAAGSPLQRLARMRCDAVAVHAGEPTDRATLREMLAVLERDGTRGCVRAGAHAGRRDLVVWRREALAGLFRSGLLEHWCDLGDRAAGFERVHSGAGARKRTAGAPAMLMSRHGSYKFGGGEHYLESAARHYAAAGYRPVIVGTRPEFQGRQGVNADGFETTFIEGTADAIRRFCLERDMSLVHVLSGLGYEVAEALAFTGIPFVYGIHYWHDCLGVAGRQCYFRDDGTPIARPEFTGILSSASYVYANSDFTRDVIERAFDVRCPIVYPVPDALGESNA